MSSNAAMVLWVKLAGGGPDGARRGDQRPPKDRARHSAFRSRAARSVCPRRGSTSGGADRPSRRSARSGGLPLEERITYFFRESGGTYGSPRITLDLWAEAWQVSVNTVAEVMAELGLQGRKPPRDAVADPPGQAEGRSRPGPPPIRRDRPDALWDGDMTEIETDEGKIYLATVLDVFAPLPRLRDGRAP